MRLGRNPGRVVGFWYLLLCFIGPLRLIYIPNKLFVDGDPAATVSNILAHEWLFQLGIVSSLAIGVLWIFLILAFYRLFERVDRNLAVQVVIFGGVTPCTLFFVDAMFDIGALMVAHGADFLSVFSKPQQDGLVVLLLRLEHHQYTAASVLWGVWLLPLALLVYRSGFVPRWLGVWLFIDGLANVNLSLMGVLFPHWQGKVFLYSQPALFGELGLMLWLLIKGAEPPEECKAVRGK